MGGAGFVYALVGAAREWMDGNLSSDVIMGGVRAGELSAAPSAAAGGAGGDGVGGGEAAGLVDRWWEEEEADGELIRIATEEASAVHWAAWQGGDGEGAEGAGIGSAVEGQQQQAAAAAWEASASTGQRGAWSYVVGLVGKPSAGKSSLFNALTGRWRYQTGF